jgi:RNA polymerase sigma-70 factor (ECF subfamily)
VIAAGRDDSADSRAALEALCRSYWPPVHAFLRRTGVRGEDALDLTQGFFAKLLERQAIRNARRERGRFRTFLLTSLKSYLADERDHARALKRGGGRLPLSLDGIAAGDPSWLDDMGHDDTPERAFERHWALTLLDRCWERLDRESAPSDPERYDQLRGFLTGDADESYGDAARELGVGESAVRVAVHRMRQRFGAILRDEVAQTVQDPADVEGELRHLLEALRA